MDEEGQFVLFDCDKIIPARWNFDLSNSRIRRVSALDKDKKNV